MSRSIAALAAVAFMVAVANATCLERSRIPDGFELNEPVKTGRFVIYGDTRKAMKGESFLRETEYDRERQLVSDRLVTERPDFIIHSGDLVGRASSGTAWDLDWDTRSLPLKRAKIPVYLAYGNHEYWFDSGEAEAHIAKRFPALAGRHWYSLRYGPALMIMLDSNFKELTLDEVARQNTWLEGALDKAGKDASVRWVIAVFHHPLYTNSVVHAPDAMSRENLLPRLAACSKLRAVFMGHVHNYERFEFAGVHYCVAGGGGAPKTAVNVTSPTYPDQFKGPAVRPFQYCVLSIDGARLTVDVMMLRDDDTWYRGDGFTVE